MRTMSYIDLKKDARLNLRVPTEMKKRLEEIAKKERRKTGDLIFLILCEYLEQLDQPSAHLLAAEDPAAYDAPRPPKPIIRRKSDSQKSTG